MTAKATTNHICMMQIENVADAVRLILHLHHENILYTPDDDFMDIVDNNDCPTFSETVARMYNMRMAELIEIMDASFDAYGVGLELNMGANYTLMDGGKILTWGEDRPTCINGMPLEHYKGPITLVDKVIMIANGITNVDLLLAKREIEAELIQYYPNEGIIYQENPIPKNHLFAQRRDKYDFYTSGRWVHVYIKSL